MLGSFGFSYIGLIYLLMLWIPNSLWARRLPEGYDPLGENKVLVIFERIGHIGIHMQHIMNDKKGDSK